MACVSGACGAECVYECVVYLFLWCVYGMCECVVCMRCECVFI